MGARFARVGLYPLAVQLLPVDAHTHHRSDSLNPTPPQLSFTSIEEDPEFPGFSVKVRADGYAGETEVWVTRGDLDRFLEELDALDARLQGEARLKCGWVPVGQPPSLEDEDTDLDLAIHRYGHAGQLQVAVTMRASARWPRRHMARIVFELPEPNALTRFRHALRQMLGNPLAPPAILSSGFGEAGA